MGVLLTDLYTLMLQSGHFVLKKVFILNIPLWIDADAKLLYNHRTEQSSLSHHNHFFCEIEMLHIISGKVGQTLLPCWQCPINNHQSVGPLMYLELYPFAWHSRILTKSFFYLSDLVDDSTVTKLKGTVV